MFQQPLGQISVQRFLIYTLGVVMVAFILIGLLGSLFTQKTAQPIQAKPQSTPPPVIATPVPEMPLQNNNGY